MIASFDAQKLWFKNTKYTSPGTFRPTCMQWCTKMMFSLFVRVEILFLVFTSHLVYQVVSKVYIDGSKALKRDAGDGVSYANFAAHKFRSLNLAPLVTALVKEPRECGKLCVDHSSCFSINLAAFHDQDGRIMCALLPSDKYNNPNRFLDNSTFHHFSIKVSEKKKYFNIYVQIILVLYGWSIKNNLFPQLITSTVTFFLDFYIVIVVLDPPPPHPPPTPTIILSTLCLVHIKKKSEDILAFDWRRFQRISVSWAQIFHYDQPATCSGARCQPV